MVDKVDKKLIDGVTVEAKKVLRDITMPNVAKIQNSSFSDSIFDTQEYLVKDHNAFVNKLDLKDEERQSLLLNRQDFNLHYDVQNWLLWISLYNNSWVFRKAIDKPAEDIANLRLKFNVSDKVKIDQLNKIKNDLDKMKSRLIELLQWGALFGGSCAVMLFDNIELSDMHKPLNEKKIKDSKVIKLYVRDRWNGLIPSYTDLVLDVKSPDFLKPKFYEFKIGVSEMFKVHHSYVLRYEHRVAPNFLKEGILQGWGYPEGAHLFTELKRDEEIKDSINSLLQKSLIEVIKMSGMKALFMGQDEESEKQLKARMNAVNKSRTYDSVTVLDTEDQYEQNEFGGLSGLSDLLEKNMESISAALDMSNILYGDMSGGFSPDNLSLVRYDMTIRNKAENFYRPILEKLLKILKIKYNIEEVDNLDFEFQTLIHTPEATGLEKAEKVVSLLSTMIGDGYYSDEQAAREIQKISEETGIGSFIDDKSLSKLSQNLENEADDPLKEENIVEEETEE